MGTNHARTVHPGASEIERWAMTLTGIEVVDVRRTSNKSKKDFQAMLARGTSGRPNDPDVAQLAEYGHAIVLPEGEALRRKLGSFTITRGSVDGSLSRAILGWAIPIGRTLFVLYLESGRKFDIPGPTPDQGMNAFAEALRAVIRGTRPSEVHTPLLSRVFRLIDHAIPLMRTLRTYGVRLHAEGSLVPLDTDDEKFMATIRAAMSDKDAAVTVARLEGDRLAIYERGEWYLSRQLLPFTWDTEWTMVQDPSSGAMIRRDLDKHVILPTAKGPEAATALRAPGRDARSRAGPDRDGPRPRRGPFPGPEAREQVHHDRQTQPPEQRRRYPLHTGVDNGVQDRLVREGSAVHLRPELLVP